MASPFFAASGKPPLTLRPNFNCEKGSVTAGGESPLTLRPNFNCEKGSVTAAAAACMPRRGIFVGENLLYNLRAMHCRTVQVKRELFSFFASFFLFSKESGGSPLTLRPNFNCEKGNVTAAAAACPPRRGIFVGENLLYNLRVIHCRTVQVERELFSFFASFFFSAKKAAGQPVTQRKWRRQTCSRIASRR